VGLGLFQRLTFEKVITGQASEPVHLQFPKGDSSSARPGVKVKIGSSGVFCPGEGVEAEGNLACYGSSRRLGVQGVGP
jgi:hypothetical protein